MIKRIFIWVVVLGSTAGLGVVISQRVEAVETDRAAQRPADFGPPAVTTVPPETKTFSNTVAASGDIEPWRTIVVSADAPGRVISVNGELGDFIQAGTPLVELDVKQLQLQRSQARAQRRAASAAVAAAKAQMGNLTTEQKRLEALVKRGAATQQELERVQSQVQSVRAQVKSTRANIGVASAGVDLADYALTLMTVQAPVAGVVVERSVEKGGYATPGAALFKLQDTSTLRLRVAVAPEFFARLQPGQKIPVVVEATSAKLTATVGALVPHVDARSRRAVVELRISDADAKRAGAMPGMKAVATFASGGQPRLAVPRRALVERHDGTVIFVERDGVAQALPVDTRAGGDETHVVAPPSVKAGERIIVVGQHAVTDGQKVTRADSPKAADTDAAATAKDPAP